MLQLELPRHVYKRVLLKVLLGRRPQRLFIDTIDQHHIRCLIYGFALSYPL
jgi:hypothetical protein